MTLWLKAKQDQKTTTETGNFIQDLIDGVRYMPLNPIGDDRGTLVELFNPKWENIEEPFTYCYQTSLLPGVVKGWAYHKLHKDRYVMISGAMKVVLYDDRDDSSTKGKINEFYLTHERPGMLTIPEFVWHADVNFTSNEAILMNFPTLEYIRDAPDKYRLPPDTDLIPYDLYKKPGG